ncbi:two-component system, OmpR family, osmolarity sensor histidine kinase EnvZ [Paraburkholderia kururiensis]
MTSHVPSAMDQTPARNVPHSLSPRSLLARNIVLLVALVAFTQICSLTVLLHYVQRPRVERAAIAFADYVQRIDRTLAPLRADEGRAAAARLGAVEALPSTIDDQPRRDPVHFYRMMQRKVFLDALRRHLPADMPVIWQIGSTQKLWIRVHVAGAPYWITLPLNEEAEVSGVTTALALSIVLALAAALTGYAIQRHINRPLRELAQAAQQLSAGESPAPLPTDGPTEIAQVSGAFNQMMEALRQAEATRALMLAGVSHDIRTPLTKLRLALAMSPSADGSREVADDSLSAAAQRYLDQIDTILQQFMDYAGSGEREIAQPGDLNALVSQLAADFAGLGHDFELSLGEVPVFAFRPVGTMRMLMNLMQNAVAYGRTGLAVRTWTEAGMACVAVGDRGKGLAADELEQLKAPFSRGSNARTLSGGTGLGLAIVERIARLHGGSLQFRPRDGGGLEALVRMPLRVQTR